MPYIIKTSKLTLIFLKTIKDTLHESSSSKQVKQAIIPKLNEEMEMKLKISQQVIGI